LADDLAKKYPGRVEVLHRPGKMGLRSAYLNGFQKILNGDAQVLVQMDADFSHDPAALVEMSKLLESCDVVLGSRYVPGGSVDKNWPLWRKNLSAFGNFYARTILGLPLHDVTTGYRMWRRGLCSKCGGTYTIQRLCFLVEMMYLAHCLQFQDRRVSHLFCRSPLGEIENVSQDQMEACNADLAGVMEFFET
jgi:dolichol-phosphate mannosyltransferase